MFSARAVQHIQHPRFEGPLENATHYGQEGTPGEGPYCQVWLRMPETVIEDARYKCNGCAAMIASASQAMELVVGRTTGEATRLEPHDLIVVLGGLPEGKEHCAERAVSALRKALQTNTEKEL